MTWSRSPATASNGWHGRDIYLIKKWISPSADDQIYYIEEYYRTPYSLRGERGTFVRYWNKYFLLHPADSLAATLEALINGGADVRFASNVQRIEGGDARPLDFVKVWEGSAGRARTY